MTRGSDCCCTLPGGVRGGWDNLLAIIPGGSSVPLLPKKTVSATWALQQLRSGMPASYVVLAAAQATAV